MGKNEKIREAVESHKWSGSLEYEWSEDDNTLRLENKNGAIELSGNEIGDLVPIVYQKMIEWHDNQVSMEGFMELCGYFGVKFKDEKVQSDDT